MSKRQRLSADETRERLIQAGIDSLVHVGLGVGLDAVNLEQAVRDAEVSRSSAYAVWSDDDQFSPQEHFQQAVLLRTLNRQGTVGQTFNDRLTAVYAEHGETASPEELLRHMVRDVGGPHVQEIRQIVEWRIVIALRTILLSAPEEERDQRLLSWLKASEKAARAQAISTIFRPGMKMLGFVPRPEFGEAAYDYIEAVSTSITEGFAARLALNLDHIDDDLQHPQDGSSGWGIYTLVFERIIDVFFMPAEDVSGGEDDASS